MLPLLEILPNIILSPPEPIDHTLPLVETTQRRAALQKILQEAIGEHDAWGLLVTYSNQDYFLYDVTTRGVWDATERAYEVRLVVGRT
jgi:hypothetical protein